MHEILKWDYETLVAINRLGNSILDPIMILLSDKVIWIPLYLWVIYTVIVKYDRDFSLPLLLIIITVIFCDQITSSIMKPFFERLRPCHDPEINDLLRLVTRCGGQFGFASSHAANTAGLAAATWLSIGRGSQWLFLWSGLVAISRVYLGVHFPFDVIVGYGLGIAVAVFLWKITTLVFPGASLRTYR